MSKDLANIIGYGADASGVWVAPKGTTAPVGLAAPASGFKEAGWLSEDGVAFGRSEDKKVFKAHQGGKIVKRMTASVDDTFKFQCLETNAVVLGLRFKGATQTKTGTVPDEIVTINVTGQTLNDERAWVVDEAGDDGSTTRYIIPNGVAESTADLVYKTDEMTVYEFTVGINGDYTIVTDAPGVVTPA